MRFSHCDNSGVELAAVSVHGPFGNVFVLDLFRKKEVVVTVGNWADLLEKSVKAVTLPGAVVIFRPVEGFFDPEIEPELRRIGFRKKHNRVEFRSLLKDLPDEIGSPIRWEAIAPAGEFSLEYAAKFLRTVAEGDPDFDPNEDPLTGLKGFLSEPTLTRGPECVQIGYVESRPAALVIAQVDLKTGWSRITYMGIAPEFRRKGLGKWVHRHGFAMMRKQGGSLYHGGTVASNESMIHLFRLHRCQEYRRMQEWAYAGTQ